jgi:hypothetical protein
MISLYDNNGNGNGNGHNGNGRKRRFPWTRSRDAEPDLTAYRRIALQLHFDLSSPGQSRSVLLAAPRGPGLCSHAAAALARCMGDFLRKPVLLVDGCTAAGNVSELMHCSANLGFADALANPDIPLEELTIPTGSDCVFFLPCGPSIIRTDQVTPERFQAFLQRAQARYDFVLLAGGDILKDPLALVMAPLVGCVTLVVFENESRIDDLDAAQDSLRICGARKVGLVWASSSGGGR